MRNHQSMVNVHIAKHHEKKSISNHHFCLHTHIHKSLYIANVLVLLSCVERALNTAAAVAAAALQKKT